MGTSIGVRDATRDILERLKRDLHVGSLDAALTILVDEHEELKTRRASDALLRSLTQRRHELAQFARRHGMESIAVFGSALHGEARSDSDLDLLVRFERKRTPGLVRLGAIERELSELLGVSVDLQTAGSLSAHIRKAVLAEALEIDVSA